MPVQQATTNHNSLEQNPVTKGKNNTKKVNSNLPETAVGVTLHLRAEENEENAPNTKIKHLTNENSAIIFSFPSFEIKAMKQARITMKI